MTYRVYTSYWADYDAGTTEDMPVALEYVTRRDALLAADSEWESEEWASVRIENEFGDTIVAWGDRL